MKRIVDGLKYDTDTAEKLASASEGTPGDFRHLEEALYRTSKGRFFLAGRGGPLTEYAKETVDGGKTAGKRLRPMSDDEAQEWLERHNETEVLEKLFNIQPA